MAPLRRLEPLGLHAEVPQTLCWITERYPALFGARAQRMCTLGLKWRTLMTVRARIGQQELEQRRAPRAQATRASWVVTKDLTLP